MATRYVILDLDQTLIKAKVYQLGKEIDTIQQEIDSNRIFVIRPIAQQSIYYVVKRKHLDFFLDQLEIKGYKVIVWSAGESTYVKCITSVLFAGRRIEYTLTRENVGKNEYKDLKNITEFLPHFSLDNARLVDDNIVHSKGQEKYCIIIRPFDFRGAMPNEKEDDDLLLTLTETIDKAFEKS